MTTTTGARVCRCGCGRPSATRQGYAGACWRRWDRQGRPEGGPTPPRAARAAVADARITRLETLFAAGLTYADAADEMGITFRSVEHYAAELNRRKRERAAAAAAALRPAGPLPGARHWQHRAACRGHADLFFGPEAERLADRQAREAAARSLCEFCPVRPECLAEGLAHKFGTWGGLTEEDRERQKRQQREDEAAA